MGTQAPTFAKCGVHRIAPRCCCLHARCCCRGAGGAQPACRLRCAAFRGVAWQPPLAFAAAAAAARSACCENATRGCERALTKSSDASESESRPAGMA
eukprot:359189-Chlamydomonas_euryale.AAC.8